MTVYVSVPLHGARAADGVAVARGARLALTRAGGRAGEAPVRVIYLDDTGDGERWSPVVAAANARRAAEDSSSVGFIGDLDRGATETSRAITEEAGIAQVVPAAGGYASMSLLLEAIRRAGVDRDAVADQVAAIRGEG